MLSINDALEARFLRLRIEEVEVMIGGRLRIRKGIGEMTVDMIIGAGVPEEALIEG